MAASMDAVNTGTGTGTGTGGLICLHNQVIGSVIDYMTKYSRSGRLNDPHSLGKLCITLARGIDYAITKNEVPLRSREIPQFLQQINIWKQDPTVLAPFMILMMSVKIACKNGWFEQKEADDLLSLANEVRRLYCTDDSLREPSDVLLSKIMARFYPRLKIEKTLTSVEVKPGYGIFVVDFSISRGMVAPVREKIGIIVARTDDMDTSSCIIPPQEVNFVLNGKGLPGRINTAMERGPLLPTNVTAVLKCGVNLLQVVGNFDGHYIIVLATMGVISSFDTSQLEDYVQPVVAFGDSELEMPSRTSLNCPISLTRMKTPVKGYLCKHTQCFDYDNFLELNSRKPCWRCPVCEQPVCFPDIRIDQNVVKVLREVGESTVYVIISKDGSWKAVSENRYSSQNEGQGDRNNFWDNSQTISAAKKLVPPEKVDDKHQNASSPLTGANKVSSAPPSIPTESPMDEHRKSQATTSSLQINLLKPNYQPVQLSSHGSSSNGFGRFPLIETQSTAIRPLQSQAQIPITLDGFNPSVVSASLSQINHFMASNIIGGSDSFQEGTERMNQASWSHVNASVSAIAFSSSMQNHSMIQGIRQPASHANYSNISVPPPVAHQSGPRQNPHSLNTAQQVPRTYNMLEDIHPISTDDWRPAGRMRGSLQGQAYSDAYRQFITQPSQPSSRALQLRGGAVTNSVNAQNSAQARAQLGFKNATNFPRSSGFA